MHENKNPLNMAFYFTLKGLAAGWGSLAPSTAHPFPFAFGYVFPCKVDDCKVDTTTHLGVVQLV
eukprot:4958661-Amphidinium_carterae.1